jgi:DNA-binding response OmpR family regulator
MMDSKRERILVIEDDPAVTRMVRALLETTGYHVESEMSGMSGLTKAADNPPELVILDVGLPDMNGYEVCRQFRQRFQPWSMPILMFTGKDKPVDQLRGFAFGADAYLTKPCEPDELLKTVALLLGRADAEFSSL